MHRNDFILSIFLGLTLISIFIVAVISQLNLTDNLTVLRTIANADSVEYRRESTEATIRAYQAQAQWAGITAIISAVGVIATFGGLIFVAAQLKVSREYLYKDRAYIHFDGMKWLSFTKPTSPNETENWGIFPRWINTGVTPALNVRVWYKTAWLSIDELPDFDTQIDVGDLTTIRPSGQIEMSPAFFPPEDIMRSGRDGTAICLWGSAVYNDVFQKNKIRETRFCVKILGYGGDPTKEWDININPVNIQFGNVGENWVK